MVKLNRPTKIFLAIFFVLVLIGVGSFFFFRKPMPINGDPQNQARLKPLPSISQSEPVPNQTPSPTTSSQAPLSQKLLSQKEFSIEKQNTSSLDELKNVPDILTSIQSVKNDFNLDNIGISSPYATAKIKNGDTILLLSGCQPQNCGGTENVIAYDKKNNKSYVLAEKISTAAGYEIIGNPPEEIQNLLIFYFTNE
jgi:hypothetical protein